MCLKIILVQKDVFQPLLAHKVFYICMQVQFKFEHMVGHATKPTDTTQVVGDLSSEETVPAVRGKFDF